MDRFEKIFDYLLKVEGGYTDNKHDKGGKTKYGIIEEEAREFEEKENKKVEHFPKTEFMYRGIARS